MGYDDSSRSSGAGIAAAVVAIVLLLLIGGAGSFVGLRFMTMQKRAVAQERMAREAMMQAERAARMHAEEAQAAVAELTQSRLETQNVRADLVLRVDREGKLEVPVGMEPPEDLAAWLGEISAKGQPVQLNVSAECPMANIAGLLHAANAANIRLKIQVVEEADKVPNEGPGEANAGEANAGDQSAVAK